MLKVCANAECNNEFEPKTHNGKYCSVECRKIVTNKSVLENYYKKKDKKTQVRFCKNECGTKLSIYNKEDICELCQVKRLNKKAAKWGIGQELIEEMHEISRKN